jgi:hypothetical protein
MDLHILDKHYQFNLRQRAGVTFSPHALAKAAGVLFLPAFRHERILSPDKKFPI